MRKAKSDAENQFNCAVGRNIERLRKNRGMRQAELALALHVTGSQIYYYEAGEHRVPAFALVRIAETFGVSLESLTSQ